VPSQQSLLEKHELPELRHGFARFSSLDGFGEGFGSARAKEGRSTLRMIKNFILEKTAVIDVKRAL
jgi:hypothetical protein